MVARNYFAGMGEAVADRTVNREILTERQKKVLPLEMRLNPDDPLFAAWDNALTLSMSGVTVIRDDTAPFQKKPPETRIEKWADVARRVAEGNVALLDVERHGSKKTMDNEFKALHRHISQASILLSGRHLQHGDLRQSTRPMEVFTNCATAASTFVLYYLLLNGSGVGRAYDDDLMKVDWSKMPELWIVIDSEHEDVAKGLVTGYMTPDEARAKLEGRECTFTWFNVPDSRGGWGKCFEKLEVMTYREATDEILVLDFSGVRGNGKPIRGMQNRPSSGPGPLMTALARVSALRGVSMPRWQQAMIVDHHAAESVLVGGARRSARMATKNWRDKTILGFINFKKDGGWWTSNNSVTVDAEFRARVSFVRGLMHEHGQSPEELHRAGRIIKQDLHAWTVFQAITEAAYHHGTGEPGLINQDRLEADETGLEQYRDLYVGLGSNDYQVDNNSVSMLRAITDAVLARPHKFITNPCGEIVLLMLGGYCVIGDVVPFFGKDDDDVEEAIRLTVRALIRVNTMDALYAAEVRRTNRIGISLTGLHEWFYSRFGFTWYDIIDEEKSREMWLTLSRFRRAIDEEAKAYAEFLGVVVPHTNATMKPAGTTSKLFGVTEGAHLPAYRWMIRWVQFREDSPLVEDYAKAGYPVRKLTDRDGTVIVGFPTQPPICEMDGGDWVVIADEATPAEQYQYLRLLEKYWIVGVEEDGVTPRQTGTGNQISYTMKYDQAKVSYPEFVDTLIDGQFSIRCCAVMPKTDLGKFEYLPEEPVTKERYEELIAAIKGKSKEDVDFVHVDCSSGSCPVDFNKEQPA